MAWLMTALVVVVQTFVRLQFVGKDRGASFYVLTHVSLKVYLLARYRRSHAYLATTLDHAEGDRLVLWSATMNVLPPFRGVHVARFAANEGFVHFDLATKEAATFLHRKTDSVTHEPRCFLSDAKVASDLIATNAVLTVDD